MKENRFNTTDSEEYIKKHSYKSKPIYINNKIYPYLEALSFFIKIDVISNNFVQKYDKNNCNPNIEEDIKTFEAFINYFKENNFDDVDDQRKEQKKLLIKNPKRIYYFFLDELHKIFKDNNEEGGCNAVEYDNQKAKKIFRDFMQNDKSYISNLFYGEKKIEKICKNCNLRNYIYKYLRAIPLDVEKIKGRCKLEDLINSIERQHERELFCTMCSSKQNFNVKIKITKKPKILIIVILKFHKKKY